MTALPHRLLALTGLAASAALPASAATDGPWYTDPKVFALGALIIFFAIVWRAGGFRLIFGALDRRGSEIQARIDEARTLRDQASKMLAEAERQQKAANEEAQQIIRRAEEDAKAMQAQALAELEARVARREAQAEARIARAREEAAADVRRAAADAATDATRQLLRDHPGFDPFDSAAGEIEKALN